MRSGFVKGRGLNGLLAVGLGVLAGATIGTGCHHSAPDTAPAAQGAPETIEVLKGGRWLFTYAEPAGTFATTDKPETIPEAARGLVRVIEPTDQMKGGADRVYVTNVAELLAAGKSSAKAMSREAFETAALAALPGGQSSPFAGRPAPASCRAAPQRRAIRPAGWNGGPPGAKPLVTVYGTSWCGACRAAREYLTSHKIPFADKDIERDPTAAQELADKASKLGIPTDRVPVIDVRGRLLLGFDQARIEALLGQPT